ncbi:MAG: class I SAM-dependent methyltransferase [Rhodoferax sp.]|jgi:SAM-dependent methyltransferase|nr:class I SAM-dependent methyltransferase [Rhodoferax sp.]HQZ05188.1 class I SAM-dependent methyltransferase [Burkholderiaceae bacterium]HRA61750.1 class I SAM-dependent methyltransferase [Burkholderiaceae bacterium]
MAIVRNIPANVSAQAAALLERAYALDGDAASRALYRDWAETYDDTMLQGLGYRSPAVVARMLGEHLADRQALVLDIGCGTGLAGHKLGELGFVAIDGLDLSPEMMQVAARRNVYRNFITADLNRPLPMRDGSYAGASCSGTFTHGHVDARCLDEVFRILQRGAPFSFTVKLEVWEPLGFKAMLAQLQADGRIAEVVTTHDRHYESSQLPDGVFCVYRRL